MTEEVKKEEVKKEEQQTELQTEEVVHTPAEERAMTEGWRPKEEWSGEEDDWKDAKTFLRDGELFKKIEEVKRENKNLRASQLALKSHYDKVKDTEYKHALETLKAQKKEALREGDTDLAVDLDDKIDAKKDELAELKRIEDRVEQIPEIHPDFARWVQRNKWYDTNQEVREFADNLGVSFKKTHMQATAQQVLDFVEEKVSKGYPELFKNVRKSMPNAVEGGTGPRKAASAFQLNELERQMMNKLVRSKVLTEAQYIADIRKLDEQGKR
jgi:hypothetical protein